jgi:hypothetical protein
MAPLRSLNFGAQLFNLSRRAISNLVRLNHGVLLRHSFCWTRDNYRIFDNLNSVSLDLVEPIGGCFLPAEYSTLQGEASHNIWNVSRFSATFLYYSRKVSVPATGSAVISHFTSNKPYAFINWDDGKEVGHSDSCITSINGIVISHHPDTKLSNRTPKYFAGVHLLN